jgi:hypothetical protein
VCLSVGSRSRRCVPGHHAYRARCGSAGFHSAPDISAAFAWPAYSTILALAYCGERIGREVEQTDSGCSGGRDPPCQNIVASIGIPSAATASRSGGSRCEISAGLGDSELGYSEDARNQDSPRILNYCACRRRCLMYSSIAGMKETKTITMIIRVRLSLTTGMLPKKYPASMRLPIQATPPRMLNIRYKR